MFYGRIRRSPRMSIGKILEVRKETLGPLDCTNGYVLDQLFSPLGVHTTTEHPEWKEICRSS